MARKSEHLTVGRRRIAVSNLDKLLYPGARFTKADVINYYINVFKYILPHLKDHPITLKRFPDGVFGESHSRFIALRNDKDPRTVKKEYVVNA